MQLYCPTKPSCSASITSQHLGAVAQAKQTVPLLRSRIGAHSFDSSRICHVRQAAERVRLPLDKRLDMLLLCQAFQSYPMIICHRTGNWHKSGYETLTGSSYAKHSRPVSQIGTQKESRCRRSDVYCIMVERVLTSGALLCMLATIMSVTAAELAPDPLPLSLIPNLFKASPTCMRRHAFGFWKAERTKWFRYDACG